MATIVHFDVPAEDMKRAKEFYEKLFGWKIDGVPGPMEYFNIATTDDEGKPGLGGGMGPKQPGSSGITNFVGVPSVDEYMKKVEELGGKIIMPKMSVPGFGFLAVFLDTEGNSMGLWETDPKAKM